MQAKNDAFLAQTQELSIPAGRWSTRLLGPQRRIAGISAPRTNATHAPCAAGAGRGGRRPKAVAARPKETRPLPHERARASESNERVPLPGTKSTQARRALPFTGASRIHSAVRPRWRPKRGEGCRATETAGRSRSSGPGEQHVPQTMRSEAGSLTPNCPAVLAFMPPQQISQRKSTAKKAHRERRLLRGSVPNPILPPLSGFSRFFSSDFFEPFNSCPLDFFGFQQVALLESAGARICVLAKRKVCRSASGTHRGPGRLVTLGATIRIPRVLSRQEREA
jgi:hypothetical protein